MKELKDPGPLKRNMRMDTYEEKEIRGGRLLGSEVPTVSEVLDIPEEGIPCHVKSRLTTNTGRCLGLRRASLLDFWPLAIYWECMANPTLGLGGRIRTSVENHPVTL